MLDKYIFDGACAPLSGQGSCVGTHNMEKIRALDIGWSGYGFWTAEGKLRYFYEKSSSLSHDGHVFPRDYRARCVK